MIIGLPDQDVRDIRETMRFVEEVDPDSLQYSIATPFPGTPFYEEVKRAGYLINDDWSGYDGRSKSAISYPALSAETIEDLYRDLSQNGRGLGWGGKKRLKRKILASALNPLQGYRDLKRLICTLGLRQFFSSLAKILFRK